MPLIRESVRFNASSTALVKILILYDLWVIDFLFFWGGAVISGLKDKFVEASRRNDVKAIVFFFEKVKAIVLTGEYLQVF